MSELSKLNYGGFDPSLVEKNNKKVEKSMSSGGSFLKLVTGKNTLRILPPRPGEQFYGQTFQHFINTDAGGNARPVSFNCPRLISGDSCPACEKWQALKRSANQKDQAAARGYQARFRAFYNVINRDDEAAGPKILAVGKSIVDQINELGMQIKEEDGVDFLDPFKGFNIQITRTGVGLSTEYKVLMSRKGSPLHEDEAIMAEWIDGQSDLTRFTTAPTYDEIVAKITGDDVAPTHTPVTKVIEATVSESKDESFEEDMFA